jgi:hypothetical protein
VRDFFREYWKSAAAGAAGSFLLSLLVGLVTRNPFGVVFLRALLLAALFAGLAAALRYLVRTHLLEQAKDGASARAGSTDTRDDRRGERVDIVLPEESPLGTERYGSGGRDSRPLQPEGNASSLGAGPGEDGVILDAGLGDGADVRGIPRTGTPVPGGFGADEAASEGLGELTEELAEELPQPEEAEDVENAAEADESGDRWSARAQGGGANAATALGARPSAARSGGGGASRDASADALESAGYRGAGEVDGSTDAIILGPRKSDERDGLPDISNLEIALEADSDQPGASKSARPGGPRPEDALRGAVSGQDPLTIARAIRTVLKRDDKG